MREGIREWVWRACLMGVAGWTFQGGCIGDIQREVEVLLRPEANPTLIRESLLVDLLGPEVLSLFN